MENKIVFVHLDQENMNRMGSRWKPIKTLEVWK
jgi:hypothetical protein